MRDYLYYTGFTRKELDEVSQIFRADLDELSVQQQGISSDELEKGIRWMRENMKIHKISPHKIDTLEQVLKGKL